MAAPAVSTHTFAHTMVIVLCGRIDEEASQRLWHALVDALMHRRPRRIVVDLAQASSLDPTAVSALIAARESAGDLYIALRLRGPGESVAAELADGGLAA